MSETPSVAAQLCAAEARGVLVEELIDSRRGLQKLLFIVFFLLLISISGNITQYQYRPEPKLVSETADGRIRPLPTLDEPIYTPEKVANWAAEKMELLYDLNFTNSATFKTRLSAFMTDGASDNWILALRNAGIEARVLEKREILRAVRLAPPAITASYIDDSGRHLWAVEMPLSTIYEGTGGTAKRDIENVALRVFVGRTSMLEFDMGIAIGKVEVSPYSGRKK